jgi:hypothetical protein
MKVNMKSVIYVLLVSSAFSCSDAMEPGFDAGYATSPQELPNGCSTSAGYVCLTRVCSTICTTFTCCLNGTCTTTLGSCIPNKCKNKDGHYCGSW